MKGLLLERDYCLAPKGGPYYANVTLNAYGTILPKNSCPDIEGRVIENLTVFLGKTDITNELPESLLSDITREVLDENP